MIQGYRHFADWNQYELNCPEGIWTARLDHAPVRTWPWLNLHSLSPKDFQLLPTRLAEISQRIDMSINPVRSHLHHCDVRREIFIDNCPHNSVGGCTVLTTFSAELDFVLV